MRGWCNKPSTGQCRRPERGKLPIVTREQGALRTALRIGGLFELVPDAIVVGDTTSGEVVLWNAAAEEIFGYPAEEAIGMPLERIVPDEFKAAHRKGLQRYARSGVGTLVSSHQLVELPGLRRDGSTVWVELRLAAAGEIDDRRYAIAILRDISDRRRAEEAAATSAGLAEQAATAMREFLGSVSHDLRAPIAGIRAAVDLLATRSDRLSAEQRADVLELARRQTNVVASMLQDLLDVARNEAGQLSAMPAAVTLADLVPVAAELADLGESVSIEIPPEAGQVWCDAAHLQRMLTNLLSNAGKYGAAPYAVRVTRVADLVEIAVEDDGPGIDEDFAARMFDRFTRADADVGLPGAGLGLAIVAALAASNGGSVGYERRDPGSRFVLRLPAEQPPG